MERMEEKKYTQKFVIPSYVQKTARMLLKEGFQAYLVGGALRDVVLGIEPDDYDLATDANPDQMLQIFPKAISTGVKFGMVTVLMPDEKLENHEVQVMTFRSEQKYIEGRWPSEVKFISEITEDLSRRDFTVNAMALNLDSPDLDGIENEKEWEIYDPFNGFTDLGIKVIRAVGDPVQRFSEDGLRAYRACRLASQLQFSIEDETFKAIASCLSVAKLLSMERVRDEFIKTLMHSPKPSVGLEYMRKSGLMEIFLPELLECYGVEQKLYHGEDVYYHLLRTCDVAHDRVKIAALFHDIGKPRKDMGNGHFYGHDIESAEMTGNILKRLRFSKNEIERNVALVRNHMFFYPFGYEDSFTEIAPEIVNTEDIELAGNQDSDLQKIDYSLPGGKSDSSPDSNKNEQAKKYWTDSAVRRFIVRVGEENIEDLFLLRIADAASNPKTAFDPKEIEALQKRISEVREKDMALKVTDLEIDGNDLLEMGIEKGPRIGYILSELLEKVIEDPLLNEKEKLKDLVREITV